MGGNVFENTKRATSKDVAYVVKLLESNSILPKDADYSIIGSATNYKNSNRTYGDIDVCVASGSMGNTLGINTSLTDTLKTFMFNNNIKYKHFKGLHIISLLIPIKRRFMKCYYVQVDIMPVDSIQYAKWSYRQPENSKFTSAVMNDALMTVAKYLNYDVSSSIDSVPVEWYRGLLDLRLGLYNCRQNVRGKLGTIIQKKTITDKYHTTNNPCKLVKLLFGDSFDLHVTDSYETIIEAINSDKFKNKKHRDTILQEIETNIMKRGEKRYAQ